MKHSISNFNFGSDVAFTNNKVFAGQTLAQILNANDVNLEPFRQAGGKIIVYHGWADPFVPPQSSIDLYAGVIEHDAAAHGLPFNLGSVLSVSGQGGAESLFGIDGKIRQALGQAANRAALRDTQSFARLFMVPGMNHCAGGPGPNSFGGAYQPPGSPLDPAHDMVEALDAWVDQGTPPARIIANKYTNDTPSQGVAFSRPLCPYPQSTSPPSSAPASRVGSEGRLISLIERLMTPLAEQNEQLKGEMRQLREQTLRAESRAGEAEIRAESAAQEANKLRTELAEARDAAGQALREAATLREAAEERDGWSLARRLRWAVKGR